MEANSISSTALFIRASGFSKRLHTGHFSWQFKPLFHINQMTSESDEVNCLYKVYSIINTPVMRIYE